MTLCDIVKRGQIVSDLHASDQWEAIDELIENLIEHGRIRPENRQAIIAAVRKRGLAMTTDLGFGISIPHARTDLIDHIIGAIGRSIKDHL